MKARKILLKKFTQVDPFSKEIVKDEQGNPAYFSYRQQLWFILRTPSQNQAMTTEELMQRAQVQFILEGAEDNKAMFLDQSQYEVLKRVLDTFKWTVASRTMAQMIEDVRNAEEVPLQPKEKDEEKATPSNPG